MAFQKVLDTIQITMHFVVSQVEVTNIYYGQVSGGYIQSTLDTLAFNVDQTCGPIFRAVMTNDCAYARTSVRGLNLENDLTAESDNESGVGALADNPAPLNVSFCIQQQSGLTGRSARGRIYCCGMPRNAFDSATGSESSLFTARADAWLAAVDSVRTEINSVSLVTAVLVSRYHNGSKRAEGETFPWTSSVYRTLKAATRRSRLR